MMRDNEAARGVQPANDFDGGPMTAGDRVRLDAEAAENIDYSDVYQRGGSDWVRASIEEAERPSPDGTERRTISATPYVCRDPRSIPARSWIFGRLMLRGSLSVVVAPGAIGKTALMVGTALSLSTGRPLLDKQVWEGPKRVWLWNLEDSAEELSRLVEAARLHWRIEPEEIGDRLFIDSALEGAELCVAVEDHTGFRILEPVIDALVAELLARQIDVLIVDPFVSSHGVSENNNTAIDAIAKKWARVAVRANCSVVIVHHTRKLNGAEVTAEAGRGAVALPNAARSALALNRMAADEAEQWGIEAEDRRRYFRAYDDKPNRAPPASKSDWYYLASVDLGNGAAGGHGDNIQVVLPWSPPDAFTGLTWEHLRDVQAKVSAAPYRADPQAGDWAGEAVAEVLGLDVTDRKARDAKRVKALLRTWLETGALVKVTEKDEETRKPRPFIRAGTPAGPESATP